MGIGDKDEWTPRIQKITDPIEMLEAILEADNHAMLGGDPYYHDILMTLMQQVEVVVEVHRGKPREVKT